MMTDTQPPISRLPGIIFCLALVMVAAGLVINGLSLTTLRRIWDDIVSRPDGSLSLRFFLQPTVSAILAIRDGIKDARTGRSPYFWTMFSDPAKTRARLREGVAATGKIILIAMLLDAAYQYIELKTFYPVEALATAILLAFIPYFLIRGPVMRIMSYWRGRGAGGEAARH